MMDQFLLWDAVRSRYTLAALDYNVGWNSVYVIVVIQWRDMDGSNPVWHDGYTVDTSDRFCG